MPMKMGIHRKPTGRGDLALLDSRMRGNDGGMFFLRECLRFYPKTPFDVCVAYATHTSNGIFG